MSHFAVAFTGRQGPERAQTVAQLQKYGEKSGRAAAPAPTISIEGSGEYRSSLVTYANPRLPHAPSLLTLCPLRTIILTFPHIRKSEANKAAVATPP